MADEEALADWLHLNQVAGIGPVTLRRLLAEFGLPARVLDASRAALTTLVGAEVAHAIGAAREDDASRERVATALAWQRLPGNHILTLEHPGYPAALLAVADPPPVLYLKGRLELLEGQAIAIVGSRNATRQGQQDASAFARALSDAGFTIVSGLALGIDAAAHRGGLAGAASTIAVVGTGADIVYPARNRELAHAIAERGLIVSEVPLGVRPLAANFPRRNRIISGLARGVLVVEAALKSGSLITARQAAEQGREVFAIPGSIHSPVARGCHALIRQGAKLVETAQDVLEELGMQGADAAAPSAPPVTSIDPESQRVLDALGFDPLTVDALAVRLDMGPLELAPLLLKLELEGCLARLPGAQVQRLVR
ncbi:MAG: DNA-protecting protein DprA [Burkholderiales bacterium]|nr:DNA-protecting protein DprA [Burkholderiales bacterium]